MRLSDRLGYVLVLACVSTGSLPGQDTMVHAGTPLTVELSERAGMRVGSPLRGRLLHPVYQANRLVLPEGTEVTGTVVELRPDHTRRVRGRLRGDFTPFYVPVVRFDGVLAADGRRIALESGPVTDGAQVYRLLAPSPKRGGLIRQEIGFAKEAVEGDIAILTGPEKGARLLQFLYSQLPYHPQSIGKGTAWTTEVSAPFSLQAPAAPVSPAKVESGNPTPGTWRLKAYLSQRLDSADAKAGGAVVAVVAEPVMNADGSVAVPQGTKLLGSVTQARPARRFGRAGVLRFDFRQMELPGQQASSVRATMKGADSTSAGFELDAEGQAKPRPKDKLALPIFLALLAARPLDQDHDGESHQLGKDASGSNGFGVIGRVVGIAAGSAELAAGIGYYQAALSTWDRWIARGKQVVFPRDTQIVVETSPQTGTALPTGTR